ncbi:MAG: Multi-sensor signal transduction histidine kinase [Pedosphaera sp.]|nr:Multi-sensor signal transduction histidine kinase [Pedosphaera sp.]
MQMNTAAVWAEDATEQIPSAKQKPPGVKLLVAMSTLALILTLSSSISVYLSGLQTLKRLTTRATEGSPSSVNPTILTLTSHADKWALQMGLTAVAGCVGFFLLTVIGGQWSRGRWVARHVKMSEEMELRTQRLLGQLANSKVLEEEARKAQNDMESRLANVSQAHTKLQRELDERKQVEKSLAQQTQQLERSKDVLEMHVQARTQELQKFQRRNELILNSAGEGICGFDLQGKATFVNPAAAKITGWGVDELIGKTEAEIFFPARLKGAKEAMGLLRDENGECLPEQLLHRKDGSSLSVEYLRTPIAENGKVVGAVVMFKDITERKLAEDKLAHKAAELARSNGELEQFAFVASHDLQEPLRKIQAFGDRLKIKCEAVKLEEGRDYLERMQSAAARMQTLINDLLTFSRVIRSSQPFVPVDLGIVTREVLVDLEHRIEKSKAQVQVDKLPTIDADPLQMRQLMQNLIGNALKFQTPEASPVVKIEAQLVTRDQIRDDALFANPPPTASPGDKFCVLTVQDNGIGFEEQYLEKIFAVFQRLHGRSEYEGTGVGLAVCRRITDRHGGLITAQSKPGEGATFVVILPMHQPKMEEHP